MKSIHKILALVIVLCMALSLGAFASGEASGASGEASAGASGESSSEALESKNTADMTPSEYAYITSYTSRDDTGKIYIGNDVTESSDIVLNESVEGPAYTAVYAHGDGVAANVTGTVIANDDTEGDMASDFSGQGAMIVANDGAAVNIKDAVISTDGFARSALIIAALSTIRVENSELTVVGANPLTETYEGYVNSANMNVMVSPPWVLGIQGGARAVNMIGTTPILTVIDSTITSGGWALISTDFGSAATINVVDSELSFLPESEGGMDSGWRIFGYDENAYGSGYGTFNIGSPAEYFYGTTINGVTYGTIVMGAKTDRFASSNGAVELINSDGEPLETVEGKGQPTVINGVFGVMQVGSIAEGLYFEDGTIVNTEDAIVIWKSGSGDYYFDNAVLNSKKGILFQMMDSDDDSRIGMAENGNDTVYSDEKVGAEIGFPGINYEYESDIGGVMVTATYTNGTYEGNIYNGTGYYNHGANNLTVTLGENAVLYGDIALTSTIKGVSYSEEALQGIKYYGDDIEYVELSEDGGFSAGNDGSAAFIQIRSYTINEYFLQGHVENKLHYNGVSTIEVVVEDGAEWNVAGESLLTKLTVAEGAAVKGTLNVNEDGTLTILAGDELIPAGEYGNIEPQSSDEMDTSASDEVSDVASGEASGAASGEGS